MSFISIDRLYCSGASPNHIMVRIKDTSFIEEFPSYTFKWNAEIIAECYENKKLNVLENLLLYFISKQKDGYNIQSILNGIIKNSQTSKYSKHFCDNYMNDIKKYIILM